MGLSLNYIMKKYLLWFILVILLGYTVYFVLNSNTKSAGWYLDQIVELRQQKQLKLDEVKLIDDKIAEYRKTMDKLQYSWLDYMSGLIQEGTSQTAKVTLSWTR